MTSQLCMFVGFMLLNVQAYEEYAKTYDTCIEPPKFSEIEVIYATSYSPYLGGQNCNESCSDYGSMLKVTKETLGKVAACPRMMTNIVFPSGHQNATVVTLHDGTQWICVDNFGAYYNQIPWPILCDDNRLCWMMRMDFTYEVPLNFPYNNWYLKGFQINSRQINWNEQKEKG